eukprot:scpid94078/ scgid18845/ 
MIPCGCCDQFDLCHPINGTTEVKENDQKLNYLTIIPECESTSGHRIDRSSNVVYDFVFNETCLAHFTDVILYFTGNCSIELNFKRLDKIVHIGHFALSNNNKERKYMPKYAMLSASQSCMITKLFVDNHGGTLQVNVSTISKHCTLHPVRRTSSSGITLIAKGKIVALDAT